MGGLAIAAATTLPSNYKLEITRLKVGLGNMLVFLPDIHFHDREEGHIQNTARAVASLDPDVVVVGGDLVDEETRDFKGLEDFLKDLPGVERLAVLGNHEYWSGHVDSTATILKRTGFKVLFNECLETSVGRVFGFDWREDRQYGEISFGGIVLAHDPNAADAVSGPALVLSGHTHGGLVLLGTTIYSNSRYSRGLYSFKDGKLLYVSRGLGHMSLQLRINSRPELLILE